MRQLLRTVLWRRLDGLGTEYLDLWAVPAGWELHGQAALAIEGQPARAAYSILCDHGWQTREVAVHLEMGETRRELRLHVDDAYRWWRDGSELHAARGCADVDLGITPATNTLPIRRCGPADGQSVSVTAAWISFPALAVEPLPQRYHRLGEERYRYESNHGAFVADLVVDELGLVCRYEGGWERIAAS